MFAVLLSCVHGVYGNTIIPSQSSSRSKLVLVNVFCVEVTAALLSLDVLCSGYKRSKGNFTLGNSINTFTKPASTYMLSHINRKLPMLGI